MNALGRFCGNETKFSDFGSLSVREMVNFVCVCFDSEPDKASGHMRSASPVRLSGPSGASVARRLQAASEQELLALDTTELLTLTADINLGEWAWTQNVKRLRFVLQESN